MKALLISLLLAGCAAPKMRVAAPTTLQVVRSLQGAKEEAERARESVKTAGRAMATLEKTSTPAQRPALAVVRKSLKTANSELIAVKHSLAGADAQAGVLQGRIDGLADDLGRAQDAERKSRSAGAFWRGWAFRLGLLSVALGIWTLRRTIAAFFGGFL